MKCPPAVSKSRSHDCDEGSLDGEGVGGEDSFQEGAARGCEGLPRLSRLTFAGRSRWTQSSGLRLLTDGDVTENGGMQCRVSSASSEVER